MIEDGHRLVGVRYADGRHEARCSCGDYEDEPVVDQIVVNAWFIGHLLDQIFNRK